MQALDWARAWIKTALLNDSSGPPNILFSFFFQYVTGSVMDINKLYRDITTLNLIYITIKKHCDKHGKIVAAPSIRPIRNCLYGRTSGEMGYTKCRKVPCGTLCYLVVPGI